MSLEALVVRALVAQGVEVEDVSAWGVRGRLPGRPEQVELGFGNLRRVLAQVTEADVAVVVDSFALAAVDGAHGVVGPPELQKLMPRLSLPARDPDDVAWYNDLAGGALRMMMVVDQPRLVRFVRTWDLVQWGLSVHRARAAALENLYRSAPDAALVPLPDLEGGVDVSVGDSYDAARLLVLDRWVPDPRGALVVVPARDLLWVAPVVGPSSLDVAAILIAEARAAWSDVPYRLSTQLYWHSEGAVHPIPLHDDGRGRVTIEVPDPLRRAIG